MALVSLHVSENLEQLEIVNQLLLPHVTEFIPINTIQDAHEAIKSMKIRGAPAIASLASLSFARLITLDLKSPSLPAYLTSREKLKKELDSILDFLNTARPTAVNLGTAVRRLKKTIHDGIVEEKEPRLIAQEVVSEARAIHDEDLQRNKDMAKWAGEWILKHHNVQNGVNILTVCNTGSLATSGYGTALGVITYLHETGRLGTAYYTQTAPYHQGSRLTALELQTLNIPSVMICDTMVGSLFQHHDIHAVVVGADRIAKNGDTANKIGTYNAAVLAARHNIPFIVVAPISTVDLQIEDGTKIPIEHRPPLEACLVRGVRYPSTSLPNDETGGSHSSAAKPEQVQVMITPAGLTGIYNPSFDVTPAELITVIATEKGVAVTGAGPQKDTFDLSGVV